MEQETLLQKIDNYLATQKPRHSLAWRIDIERRIILLNSNFPEQHIRKTHRELMEEMIETAKRNTRSRFTEYSTERIEDIVNDALVRWLNYFNGDVGIEGAFSNLCIQAEISEDFNTESPILSTENAIDDSGQELLDKDNKQVKVEIRATTKRTDFIEKQKEAEETNDDEIAEPKKDDIDDTLHSLSNGQNKAEEEQQSKGFDILSRDNRILNAKIYDDVRLKFEEEEEKAKPKKVKTGTNANRIKTAEIIFRHYELKDSAASQGINTAPVIAERFIPQTDFVNDINKGTRWNGFYT